MNTCNFLVKIISSPEQRKIEEDISVVEAQIQFPKVRKKKGVLSNLNLLFGETLEKIF